jgi:hypothetical protein
MSAGRCWGCDGVAAGPEPKREERDAEDRPEERPRLGHDLTGRAVARFGVALPAVLILVLRLALLLTLGLALVLLLIDGGIQ